MVLNFMAMNRKIIFGCVCVAIPIHLYFVESALKNQNAINNIKNNIDKLNTLYKDI